MLGAAAGRVFKKWLMILVVSMTDVDNLVVPGVQRDFHSMMQVCLDVPSERTWKTRRHAAFISSIKLRFVHLNLPTMSCLAFNNGDYLLTVDGNICLN